MNMLRSILIVLGLLVLISSAQAKYSGGSGTAEDPYLINTAEQMNAIGTDPCDWDKHFKLMADIDLGVYTGESFNIIGNSTTKFTGVFDGNDHTISNLTYSSTGKDHTGLFGYVYGEIRNLGLIDPTISAGTGQQVGSLAGELAGHVFGCYADGGSVVADANVGGLVGENRYGSVVSNCYATTNVSGTTYVGGLVGRNRYKILDSYARGPVSGSTDVGGLLGYNTTWGIINSCYSTGSVSGTSNSGGLVGLAEDGAAVNNSFWDTETSGEPNSAGGTPKTTTEMQDPNTFLDAGWDFVGETENGVSDLWAEPNSTGYMILWYQLSPLPALPSFSGGSGTAEDPYLISMAGDLNNIGQNPRLMEAHFRLVSDVNLAGSELIMIGGEVCPFTGTFDGNDHDISNLTYSSTEPRYIGLFRYVSGGLSEIKDLRLIDPNIAAGTSSYVASLVGRFASGTISGCRIVNGNVLGVSDVGLLVGYSREGSISDCNTSGTVLGSGIFIGGLVGGNRDGPLNDCSMSGSVSGDMYVGGLTGYNSGGNLTNCTSSGDVSGGGSYVGGLLGYNYQSELANCTSSGSVSGSGGYVGGLVGSNYQSNLNNSNCTPSGSVSGGGNYVGGLVGKHSGADTTISDCNVEGGSVSGDRSPIPKYTRK